jgi:preprotein translocase subunit SecG
MQSVLLVIHLIVAIALIGTVMLQRSEGGALGMGGSSSGGGNLFSARGVGNALTRTTAILAACFFLTSISLTLLALRGNGAGGSIFNGAATTQQQPGNAPAAPATGDQGGSVLPKLPTAPATPQVPVSQ